MKPAKWLLIIVLYTIITMAFAHLAASNPALIIFSGFFGFTFVALIPGYCLLSLIFPEGKLDIVEIAVLSIALSFSIAGISGLFLGLSPIGINTNSITYTLSSIVLILAILTYLKKENILNIKLRKLSLKNSTPVST